MSRTAETFNAQRPTRRSRNKYGRMIWGQNHGIQIILLPIILPQRRRQPGLVRSRPLLKPVSKNCDPHVEFACETQRISELTAQFAANDFRTSGRSSPRSLGVGCWRWALNAFRTGQVLRDGSVIFFRRKSRSAPRRAGIRQPRRAGTRSRKTRGQSRAAT